MESCCRSCIGCLLWVISRRRTSGAHHTTGFPRPRISIWTWCTVVTSICVHTLCQRITSSRHVGTFVYVCIAACASPAFGTVAGVGSNADTVSAIWRALPASIGAFSVSIVSFRTGTAWVAAWGVGTSSTSITSVLHSYAFVYIHITLRSSVASAVAAALIRSSTISSILASKRAYS
jgi:hypothetical protein